MAKYEEGSSVIDTNKNIAPTVACILPNQGLVEQLYMLVYDDSYYVTNESSIIPYDKYYFEEIKKGQVN